MKTPKENPTRRQFIGKVAKTGLALGALSAGWPLSTLAESAPLANPVQNVIPRWKGFNLLDFFSANPARVTKKTTAEHFKWMRDWGFDFVRLPMAYPYYLRFDRSKPIGIKQVRRIDNKRVDEIEQLVYLAHQQGLHVSLNLHRAPGYCVNSGFQEPYNLWKDAQAMEDFAFHWGFWAKRFRNVSKEKISFDLLNEPSMREDMNDQHSKRSSVPGDLYRKMAIAASTAIRKNHPDPLIVADGNNVGNDVIPEITDLNIAQSCRGYHPALISHYQAWWAFKQGTELPEPKWPGQVGDQHFRREMLEEFYQPWIELVKQGVGVHCGECGCYNKTPHAVFLAWFEDVLDVLTSNGIGYALWNFIGDFGILDSGRADVEYEDWYGHKLDRKLLTLLMKY